MDKGFAKGTNVRNTARQFRRNLKATKDEEVKIGAPEIAYKHRGENGDPCENWVYLNSSKKFDVLEESYDK